MAGMSVDGLVSGLDTTNLINSLIQVESASQTALKTRMTAAQDAADAYRSINKRFDGIRAAAETALKPATWNSAKATSSSANVTVALGTAPQTGSLTFSVHSVAASHSVVSNGTTWSATDQPAGFTQLTMYQPDGITPAVDADGNAKVITVGGAGTLADAVAAVNASDYGLSATAVQVAPNEYRLQVTSKTSGADAAFSFGSAFDTTTQGTDALLKVGTTADAYEVTSPTNSFAGLLPGSTITVGKADPGAQVTVGVAFDPDAVASKVQALVDAVNSALGSVEVYSTSTGGATAVLKGDSALSRLAGEVLKAVSYAVGSDGSPGAAGLQLTRDGTVEFNKDKFLAALAEDPALVQRLLVGSPAVTEADGTEVPAVPGAVERLMHVAKAATDETTGTLNMLAKSRDNTADGLQDQIEAWDLRLELRRTTLTRQFTAMETALSTMQQQSSWLAGQISSLPSLASS